MDNLLEKEYEYFKKYNLSEVFYDSLLEFFKKVDVYYIKKDINSKVEVKCAFMPLHTDLKIALSYGYISKETYDIFLEKLKRIPFVND